MSKKDYATSEHIKYISTVIDRLLSEQVDEVSLKEMNMTPWDIECAMETLDWESECDQPSYRDMILYFSHPDREEVLVLFWDVFCWQGSLSIAY